VQVDSIKTRVESAPWFQRLKIKCDKLLSNFAFNFNLRRYTKVIFVPADQNNVGVLDTADGSFITVATTGDAASGANKYRDAAAVGTKVYFAPFKQNNIGVFDTLTNIFNTIAIATTGDSSDLVYQAGGLLRTSTRPTLFLHVLRRASGLEHSP